MRVAFYMDLPGTRPTKVATITHVPSLDEVVIVDGDLRFVSTRVWTIDGDGDPVVHVYLSKAMSLRRSKAEDDAVCKHFEKWPEGRTMNERENPNG